MKCDFSKNITLSKAHARMYGIFRFGLYISFFIGCTIFALEVLLPHIPYTFTASIDSLANTITRPTEGDHGTTFSVTTASDVDTAHLTISFTDDTIVPRELDVRKSYGSFLYSISEEVTRDIKRHTDSEHQTNSLLPYPIIRCLQRSPHHSFRANCA